MSLTDNAGSVEALGIEDVPECSHGRWTFPDEEGWHAGDCERDAVALVPQPNSIAIGRRIVTLAVCEYHLARYAFHFPKRTRAVGVEDLVPDDAWTTLEAVPPAQQRAGGILYRVGLDQHGRAHYVAGSPEDQQDDAGLDVRRFDGRLELVGSQMLSPSDDLVDWLEFVRERRGWVGVEEGRVADYVRGDES